MPESCGIAGCSLSDGCSPLHRRRIQPCPRPQPGGQLLEETAYEVVLQTRAAGAAPGISQSAHFHAHSMGGSLRDYDVRYRRKRSVVKSTTEMLSAATTRFPTASVDAAIASAARCLSWPVGQMFARCLQAGIASVEAPMSQRTAIPDGAAEAKGSRMVGRQPPPSCIANGDGSSPLWIRPIHRAHEPPPTFIAQAREHVKVIKPDSRNGKEVYGLSDFTWFSQGSPGLGRRRLGRGYLLARLA